MTDEEALLRAVMAEPDNLETRLTLADWYEEQGDSRCEFIRLQIALARLPEAHPWRSEFVLRTKALLRRYRRRWDAPLHRKLNQTPLKGLVRARKTPVRRWKYRRGFVEVVRASADAFVRHGDVLLDLGPVNEARLFAVRSSLSQLARSPHVRQLRALDLRQNALTPENLATLLTSRHLEELRSLDLSQNRLGDMGAVLLSETKALPALERLYLWGETLSEEPILRLQARFGLGVRLSDPYGRNAGDWFTRRRHSYDDHLAYDDGKALADGVEVDEFDSLPDRRAYDADYDFEKLLYRDDDPERTVLDGQGRHRPDEVPMESADDLWDDWEES